MPRTKQVFNVRVDNNERNDEPLQEVNPRQGPSRSPAAAARAQLRAAESPEIRQERLQMRAVRRVAVRQLNFERCPVITHKAVRNWENFIENEIDEHYAGGLTLSCSFCKAKYFLGERTKVKLNYTTCCANKTVHLQLPQPNQVIQQLMTGDDPDSPIFLKHIRSYNSAFAFASVGAKVKLPPGFGPYCFRINGQIVHRTGPLHPPEQDNPQFGQLYILDSEEANSIRMTNDPSESLRHHVMQKLSALMETNPLTRAYKMLHEVERQESRKVILEGGVMPKISMAILQNRSSDARRYNAQQCNEVAAVFVTSDGLPPLERDLLIHLRVDSGNIRPTQRISTLNKNLDALCYPLIFPSGEQGWSEDIALCNLPAGRKRRTVTLKMYYSYMLQIRDEFNPILRAGRLTQQYVVDAYVRAESNDLSYLRRNQKDLKVEKYSSLINYANTLAENENEAPGTPVILPSTFSGSPRNMQQLCQDAMAVVRVFGKPDLFVTMTCNPKWPEIIQNLAPNEKVENRPDLVCRVFNLKLEELQNDIKNNDIFGKVKAMIHVIEFQKRGLPHAHILITLTNDDKPRTADIIDKIVCAEIPDPEKHPNLYKTVLTNMIHGPCSDPAKRSPCVSNGKCSKGFPKPFREETNANVNGYPLYRRRKKEAIQMGKFKIDNSWVVPFSPYLSLKYNCHINVEICTSIKSVKYLFKYAYKGYDSANISIRIDEIQTFVDTRYVSPPEATWRIFRFPMHSQTHTIYRLAVHNEDEQRVVYDPNSLENVVSNEPKDSTLTAWFKLNQTDIEARKFLYHEIPEHYVFNDRTRTWQKRQRGHNRTIGRIHDISIKDTDVYFLRILLLHLPGVKSYVDILTVNGTLYDSFMEAAKARGYITDESLWGDTLNEASASSLPRQLRYLFAHILAFGGIADARPLWENHKSSLVEDLARRHMHDADSICTTCENFALIQIQRELNSIGWSCASFHLPTPSSTLIGTFDDVVNAEEERTMAEEKINSLNEAQRNAFNSIIQATENNDHTSKCFFLDGVGGAGKTFLYETLLAYIRGQHQKAIPVASTGIASNLLKGGSTYHSKFKLPLKLNETSVSRITDSKSLEAKEILECKAVIWDESTMATGQALNVVDQLFRKLTKTDVPFGSKVMLLGGDFRQTLPVIPGAGPSQVVLSSIKFCELWPQFNILKLTKNERCQDIQYSNWILDIGNGDVSNNVGLDKDMIEIPEAMIVEDALEQVVFGDKLTQDSTESIAQRAILCPTNDQASEVNNRIINNLLEGDEKVFYSMDSIDSEDHEDQTDYSQEVLNSFEPSGMPPHKLILKNGAIVMLLRNLNSKRGLCNGTRLIIIEMKTNVILGKVITGSAKGEVVFIPRINLTTEANLPFKLCRKQFPIKVAFAMTINKSQGQTLEFVGINLITPVFDHGQLYVAFSRVRNSDSVRVFVKDTQEQGRLLANSNRVFTRNIVYRSVLQ